jgi:hypothetical protein
MGSHEFKALFTPSDLTNYTVAKNIPVSVTVTGGTATVITAWVDGETIATSADDAPPVIIRTAGDSTNASLAITVTGGTYDSYAWTVNGVANTADVTNSGQTFTFDATWRSNGAYTIGLAVTRGGATYSTIITVTVQD